MKNKELRIEDLAKKLGNKKGFKCKPEERCADCLLSENCPCLEHARMVIDLGYEESKEIARVTAQTILAHLKSHAYLPNHSDGLPERRVVDEDDIERVIEAFLKK